MIGIDEHTIHREAKFTTTIPNLANYRIYDIIEGKSPARVEKILTSHKHRKKVTMVCMDLSSGYRRLVERCFPNVKVVADRFHVIRMVQHHFMEFGKQAQESICWKRPFLHSLRKRACILRVREGQTLKQLFEINPAIGVCHRFKERTVRLVETQKPDGQAIWKKLPKAQGDDHHEGS